jgi:hypothetical protein
MEDSDSHLGPGHARGLAPGSPSPGPSGRPSADDARSQDELLSRNTAGDNEAREPRDTVPYAPLIVQQVPAENPTHATNRPLG